MATGTQPQTRTASQTTAAAPAQQTYPFKILKADAPITRFTAFIYGFAGSGKTYLARSMINTPMAPILLCSCDEGYLTLKGVVGSQLVVAPTNKMADFNDIVDYLSKGRHPFKTVFIDNISELYRTALNDRAAANSRDKVGRNAFSLTQQDYGEARNQLLDLVSSFNLGLRSMNVIITALANRAQGQDSSTVEISLAGKVAYEVPAYSDIVGYLYKERHPTKLVREWTAAGKPIPPERRVLQIDSSSDVPTARNRGGFFKEDIMNPNLYEIYKTITEAPKPSVA